MRAHPGAKKVAQQPMQRNRSDPKVVQRKDAAPPATGEPRKKAVSVTFKQGPPQEVVRGGRRIGHDLARGSYPPEADAGQVEPRRSPNVNIEIREVRQASSDSDGDGRRQRPVMLSARGSGGARPEQLEDEEAAPLPAARKGRGNNSPSSNNRLQVPEAGVAANQGGSSDIESERSEPGGLSARRRKGLSPRPEKRENIHVVVRIRPSLPHEDYEPDAVEVQVDGQSIRLDDGEANERKRTFTVDEVIDSRESDGNQVAFFNRVGRPLMLQSLQGYNVCIFAYGHTGSGKTFTMLGDGTACTTFPRPRLEGAGLLPRYIKEVFQAHVDDPMQRAQPPRYSCEFYEVYNEQIRDLLAPPEAQGNERKRTVHAHPRHGVRIEGLSTSVIQSPEETLNLVNFGNQMRTVAATTMNERSSRSHAVFTFRWEVTADSPNRGSTVTFVDLAGREDIANKAKDVLFREMCYINTSLFHLAHLISKIADGQIKSSSLADFRNSKLTLLLAQALVGNSRTALVATIAPARSYYDNSLSTLQFAQQVKKIETKPIVNNRKSGQVVADLEAEVKTLRKELTQAKSSNTETEQELLAAQAMIEKYRVSWEEAQVQSKNLDRDRRKFSVKLGLLDMSNGPEWTTGGEVVPFLTKLSDDAALQGCCNYILNKPAMRIGSEEACDILLHGVGIRPEMCEANCSEGGEVSITLQCDDLEGGGGTGEEGQLEEGAHIPRVLVNGQLLSPESPTRIMHHGDCLVLGYAHAFRLVAPSKDQLLELAADATQDVATLARNTVGSLDMASAVAEVAAEEETGGHFKEVYPYLQQLSTRAPESTVQELLRSLKSLQPLIDEANVLTGEVFQEDTLRFEMHALTDILHFECDVPQLVVCVVYLGKAESSSPMRPAGTMMPLLSMPFSPSSDLMASSLLPRARAPIAQSFGLAEHMMLGDRTEPILYVWSLEKFLQRLQEMREVYTEGIGIDDGFESVRQRFKQKPHTNPWREMRFKDVRVMAEAGWEASSGSQPGRMTPRPSPTALAHARATGLASDATNPGEAEMSMSFGMYSTTSGMTSVPSAPAGEVPNFGGVMDWRQSGSTMQGQPSGDAACVVKLSENSNSAAGAAAAVSAAASSGGRLVSNTQCLARQQTLAEVARSCAAPSASTATMRVNQPVTAAQVLSARETTGSVDDTTSNATTPAPHGSPVLEARPPDIEKLRMELLACRAETGRFTAERDRFAKLLDRLEGLLTHLSTEQQQQQSERASAAENARRPRVSAARLDAFDSEPGQRAEPVERPRMSSYRSWLRQQSHSHYAPTTAATLHADGSATTPQPLPYQLIPTRRTVSPPHAIVKDDSLPSTYRRQPAMTAWAPPASPPVPVVLVKPPASHTTAVHVPRVPGAPSSATVPSGRRMPMPRRMLMRSLSNPLEPLATSPGPPAPQHPWMSPGVPSRGPYLATPRISSRSASPLPGGAPSIAASSSVPTLPTSHEIADMLFNQLDGNKDGILTRSEFQAGMADSIFNQLDRNKDGVVTRSEFRAGVVGAQSQPSLLTPLVTPLSGTPRASSPAPREPIAAPREPIVAPREPIVGRASVHTPTIPVAYSIGSGTAPAVPTTVQVSPVPASSAAVTR